MRFVIPFIGLLISQVIIFVIIGSRDFYSANDAVVQEKLLLQKDCLISNIETESEPLVKAVPMEIKPVETNPVANNMLVEENPVEIKPLSEEKLAPSVIPVVTAEKAKELNDEARKKVKRKDDKKNLEGVIKEISQCPDPKSIDYPDCNLSAKVLLNDIDKTMLCLIVPCIRNSEIVLPKGLQKNKLIAFRISEEENLSEDEKSIQLVDDDPNLELDCLYVDYIEPISEYSKISQYVKRTVEEIHYDKTIVLTDKDKETRKEYINKELKRLNRIIADYSTEDAKIFSDTFSEFTKDMDITHPYAEIQYEDGSKKIFPVEVTVTTEQYLKWALSNDTNLMIHNAKVIASIDNYLREKGILLLVVPIPHAYESYINRLCLSPELSTYNINRILFMRELLSSGVEVLDIEPMIEKNIMSYFHYYRILKKDVHLSEIGAYYLAQYIYDHLKRYEYLETLIKNDYSIKLKPVKEKTVYYGEQFRDMDSMLIEDNLSPVNKQSPFLIAGDSFSINSHIQNYIAYFLKTKIYGINRSSSFAATAWLLQTRSSEISPNTKVCILIDFSGHLGYKFVDLLQEGTQIYPSESLKNTNVVHMDCEDLFENSCSCKYNLPDYITAGKYKLVVYTKTNNIKISFNIWIDSQQKKQLIVDSHGYSCTELQLPSGSTDLHLNFSATLEDVSLAKEESFLQVTRIVLVEE